MHAEWKKVDPQNFQFRFYSRVMAEFVFSYKGNLQCLPPMLREGQGQRVCNVDDLYRKKRVFTLCARKNRHVGIFAKIKIALYISSIPKN